MGAGKGTTKRVSKTKAYSRTFIDTLTPIKKAHIVIKHNINTDWSEEWGGDYFRYTNTYNYERISSRPTSLMDRKIITDTQVELKGSINVPQFFEGDARKIKTYILIKRTLSKQIEENKEEFDTEEVLGLFDDKKIAEKCKRELQGIEDDNVIKNIKKYNIAERKKSRFNQRILEITPDNIKPRREITYHLKSIN